MSQPDSDKAQEGLSYQQAGVNIDEGNRLVELIKPLAKATQRPEVMGGLGGFGGLFALPVDRYKKPVLVSGTDGVGTKLKIALEMGKHDTIGIDLVAMCVNDIAVTGAEPLFFLDYYATGALSADIAADVVRGISNGCIQAGAALIGGETAEMPGMYAKGDYDIAGFCVGIVDQDEIIDGREVKVGDALIAIASSGAHSNGYSLIRRIVEQSGAALDTPFGASTLGAALLEPTRIYVKPLLSLARQLKVKAVAHITGGGLLENVPRVLPDDCTAYIDSTTWEWPALFAWLKEQGRVAAREMYRTFNCGVGMVICVDRADAARACNILNEHGEKAWQIGEIETSSGGKPAVRISGL